VGTVESAEFRAQEGAPRLLRASPQREARISGCPLTGKRWIGDARPQSLPDCKNKWVDEDSLTRAPRAPRERLETTRLMGWATAGLAPRAQLVPSEFLLVLVIPARVPCPAEKSTLKTQLQPGAPRHGCLRILVEDEAKLRLFGSASPTLRAPVIAHGWLVAFAHTHTHTHKPKLGGVASSPRIPVSKCRATTSVARFARRCEGAIGRASPPLGAQLPSGHPAPKRYFDIS
jgi:hypothetical protein